MGYYIRVLTPSKRVPCVGSLRTALEQNKLSGVVTVDAGTEADWTQILLSHVDGAGIAVIERRGGPEDASG
jgi:hypothetical protein